MKQNVTKLANDSILNDTNVRFGLAMVLSLLIISPTIMAADDPRPLRFLGVGGCRTVSGGQGEFDIHKNVNSAAQCKELCQSAKLCEAIEYNKVKRECEVHRKPIIKVSERRTGNTTCYTKYVPEG
jgi:hypothetical protein